MVHGEPPHRAAGLRLIAESAPKSQAAEAYRTLRTNIQFTALDRPVRTVVITSTVPEEGKTTTAANFAVVTAQTGSRVCLVDTDLRRPTLHQIFELHNERGLTNALVEGLAFAKVAQATRVPNLWVVTSGPLPPVHGELVGSKRMHDLLEGAAADFDLIICDSPPVMAVSDAVALSAQCDGVVLVVRVGGAAAETVRRTAEQIESVNGRILGVLLNRADTRRDGYYTDYFRYYHEYTRPKRRG
ncbi:MAG TPA: CpsD/CapB family tyrosine-protein kinase [Methylomirabilota bacterium]|nr:CpsD/CapB family tyrosine-protein kinase [Methylomirabilota bacterium]